MTTLNKPVTRQTAHPYRIALFDAYPSSDAYPSDSGRRLVVTLADEHISIRESGRRHAVRIGIPELYRRLLVAQAQANRRQKGTRR